MVSMTTFFSMTRRAWASLASAPRDTSVNLEAEAEAEAEAEEEEAEAGEAEEAAVAVVMSRPQRSWPWVKEMTAKSFVSCGNIGTGSS